MLNSISISRAKTLSTLQWSQYQQQIFDWVLNGSGHGRAEAVAGSGKTTTIKGVAQIVPSHWQGQILAFNRHIADKLKSDPSIPKNFKVATAHSFALGCLVKHRGMKPNVNAAKYHSLARNTVDQTFDVISFDPQSKLDERAAIEELRFYLRNIINFSRLTLISPNSPEAVKELSDRFELCLPPILDPYDWAALAATEVLREGQRLAIDAFEIDYIDMLWLIELWDLSVPHKDLCLIDEAQDANALMLALYRRIARAGARMLFFGDGNQAIFGFMGSDSEAWERLEKDFKAAKLPLSVCYRCPSSHLDLARRLVPQIEARPGIDEGVVKVIPEDRMLEVVQANDLILNRFNAPLIKACLKLILNGTYARVRGRDIGRQLTQLASTALGNHHFCEFSVRLGDYCSSVIAALKNDGKEEAAESMSDRQMALIYCFEQFGDKCQHLDDFCCRIESLFVEDRASVTLSTIHRAKGDEANRVFLLGCQQLPLKPRSKAAWRHQEELNIAYVALTRAKAELYLVPSGEFAKTTHCRDLIGGMKLPESA